MRRWMFVSLFVLAALAGASVGALVGDSSEQPFADGQPYTEAGGRRQLIALANERARLRKHAERVLGASRDAPGGVVDDEREEPGLAEILAHEREIAERRAAVIVAALDREAVDPTWGPATEHQITAGLAAHGPPGVALVSATCKTTLCIVELEHPEGDLDPSHVDWLRVFGLSRGFFVHHPAGADRRARTTAHLARKGYSLPRAGSNASGRRR